MAGGGRWAAWTHGALAAAVAAVAERLSVSAEDDVLLLGDDVPPSPLDLLMPLVHGRSLMLSGPAPAPGGPPGALVLAAPPAWQRALTAGWTPPAGSRLVCVGGVLDPELVDMLARTGCQVFLGRPAPRPLATPLALAPLDGSRGRHLGPALAGTVRSVLDVRGVPVPEGVVGELHLADAAHPPVSAGLLCRRSRGGALEVLGPAEGRLFAGDQVITAAAVEQRLCALPGVRGAAVTADRRGALVAWLVAEGTPAGRAEREAFAAQVRARARAALPACEVPEVFVVVDGLPLGADGAVDRGALPAPPEQPAQGLEDAAPRNDVERQLLELFREVLKLPQVGVHSDFFGLGGHSLLAAKLLSRVREEFGLQVPVREFFRQPTPTGLAAAVEELERARERRPTVDEAVLSQLAGMSDDEIDQLLRQLK